MTAALIYAAIVAMWVALALGFILRRPGGRHVRPRRRHRRRRVLFRAAGRPARGPVEPREPIHIGQPPSAHPFTRSLWP